MKNEYLKLAREIAAAGLVISTLTGCVQSSKASENPIVPFEQLIKDCQIPDRAFKQVSNNYELGSIATFFDPISPERHGQLTAVLTHQNWQRDLSPKPYQMEYPNHDFSTQFSITRLPNPKLLIARLTLTDLTKEEIIDDVDANIVLSDDPSGTPVTFCWTEGKIRYLFVGNLDLKDPKNIQLYTTTR
jgi:hypothetical protein